MKIYFLSKTDFEFSAQLVKICERDIDSLKFVDNIENLNNISFEDSHLLLVDCDDFKGEFKKVIKCINNKSIYVCGIVKKINKTNYNQAMLYGFDIFLTKSNFLLNIKTIKSQLKIVPSPKK